MKNLIAGLTLMSLLLGLSAIPQAAEDKSLVLYFDFEDGAGKTVTDRSEYGNDGKIEGKAKWVDGNFGQGLEFDGSSFIVVPDADEFHITDKLTLACWAKVHKVVGAYNFLVCRWNWAAGNHRCYETYLMAGAPAFVVSSDGADAGATSFVSPDMAKIDRWVNIVGVFDGSKVITYVDGKKMGAANHKGQIVDVETPVIIGDNNNGGDANFRFYGVMDEVAIYNRDLSQDEIREKMADSHMLSVAEPDGKLSTTWGNIKLQY